MKTNPKSILWIFFATASYVVIATLLLWLFYGMPVGAETATEGGLEWQFDASKDVNGNSYLMAYIVGIGGKKDNAFALSIRSEFKHITGRYIVVMGIVLELPQGVLTSPLAPLVKIDDEVIDLVVSGVSRETLVSGYIWQFKTNNLEKNLLLTKIRNAKRIEMKCMLFPRGEAHFILDLSNTNEVVDKLIAYLLRGRANDKPVGIFDERGG